MRAYSLHATEVVIEAVKEAGGPQLLNVQFYQRIETDTVLACRSSSKASSFLSATRRALFCSRMRNSCRCFTVMTIPERKRQPAGLRSSVTAPGMNHFADTLSRRILGMASTQKTTAIDHLHRPASFRPKFEVRREPKLIETYRNK